MTAAPVELERRYPRTLTVANNTQVTLRLLDADGVDRMVEFARRLPEEELLFLRNDITQPEVVRDLLRRQQMRRALVILAYVGDEMGGYGDLTHNDVTWERHLGEIRLNVGPRYRSLGLGRSLLGELFDVARQLGLRKLIARMVAEQRAAVKVFEKFSFQPEALLRDFAIDRNGRTHDLVMMSYDVEGLTDRAD